MGRALPQELRDQVVAEWRHGSGSIRELAERFGVGEATVNRWVTRFARTGSAAPLPHGGGQTLRIPDDKLAVLAAVVRERPDLSRRAYVALFRDATGIEVAVHTMGRALRRLGCTRDGNRWSPPGGPVDASAGASTEPESRSR